MAFISGITLYVVLGFTGLSVLILLLSIAVYREVAEEGEAAMARFQLEPERTKQEFMAFWGGSAFMVLGLLSYAYGAVVEDVMYLNVGRIAFSIFTIILIGVFYDWWRRF